MLAAAKGGTLGGGVEQACVRLNEGQHCTVATGIGVSEMRKMRTHGIGFSKQGAGHFTPGHACVGLPPPPASQSSCISQGEANLAPHPASGHAKGRKCSTVSTVHTKVVFSTVSNSSVWWE